MTSNNLRVQRRHLSLFGFFVAVSVVSLIPTGSASAAPTSIAPVTNVGGKCLDVRGGKAASGTRVQLYRCNSTPAQQWLQLGDGTFRNRGLCLDVRGGETKERTLLQLYTCNGTKAQQWKVNENKALVAGNSGLCADSQYGRLRDGDTIWTYGCNASRAQQWAVVAPSERNGAPPAPTVTPTSPSAPAPSATVMPSGSPEGDATLQEQRNQSAIQQEEEQRRRRL